MFLSVVIPVYNESVILPIFLNELEAQLKRLKAINAYEVIICDDHSTDKTFEMIKGRARGIKIIRFSRRIGSLMAIRAGLRMVKGDAALYIAGDGQDNPRAIDEMLKKLNAGYDLVWAVRRSRDEPFFSKTYAELFYKILGLFIEYDQRKLNLANADFFLIGRKVIEAVNQCQEKNTSFFGLLLWLGFKQDYVLYDRRRRLGGASKWNFWSKLKLATDWIVAFSELPLRFITVLGGVILCMSVLYGLSIFIRTGGLHEAAGAAWFLVAGAQLASVGILGEYLGRTFDETRKRPLYFIEASNMESQKKENIQLSKK